MLQDSGSEDVVQFATAIRFCEFERNNWKSMHVCYSLLYIMQAVLYHADIEFINNDNTPHEIKVTPTKCCLFIEEDDVDCEVYRMMTLKMQTTSLSYRRDMETDCVATYYSLILLFCLYRSCS